MIRIQVLGLGNSQHRKLSSNLRSALQSIGLNAEVEQVTDVDDILKYRISAIPAVLVNGHVLFENGYLPTVDELSEMLSASSAA